MNLNRQGGGDPHFDSMPPGSPGVDPTGHGAEHSDDGIDLSQCADHELAQELMRRYPEAFEPSPDVDFDTNELQLDDHDLDPALDRSPFAGVHDPMEEVVRRLAERDAIVDHIVHEIEEHLGQMDAQDVRALRQLLKAPDMTPGALRELHAHGLLLTHAKGLAYDRMHSQTAGGHTPAPVTPNGGSPREGLSPAELNRIRELAPRLQVPVDELKAQYVARKRQSR